jgi:hypothetical protein
VASTTHRHCARRGPDVLRREVKTSRRQDVKTSRRVPVIHAATLTAVTTLPVGDSLTMRNESPVEPDDPFPEMGDELGRRQHFEVRLGGAECHHRPVQRFGSDP